MPTMLPTDPVAPTVAAEMHAFTQRRYGGPEVLRQVKVPVPIPKPDEVLVRVHAAAVHRGDVHLMTGRPYLVRLFFGLRRPRQPILGQEIAGTVVAVGADVANLSVGDAVLGPVGKGGFAEYVCAPADKLARKPSGWDFESASAIGDSAMTALQALRDQGNVQPGDRVLINGASGGVGTFAVQIAKALGATVTAVCSSAHVDRIRALGADEVLDYTKEDFTLLRDFDVVLDLAGSRPMRHCRRVLKPGGTLVSCAGPRGDWVGPLVWMFGALFNKWFSRHRVLAFLVEFRSEDLRTLVQMVEAGDVVPVIEQVMPFAQVGDALRHVAAGHAHGKTVLTHEIGSASAPSSV